MNAARTRKKKGIRLFLERWTIFLFFMNHPPAVVVFLIVVFDQENHGKWIDYRRGTVSYDTTDLRRARGVRFGCCRYFITARHRSISHSITYGLEEACHRHWRSFPTDAWIGIHQILVPVKTISPIFRLSPASW